MRRAWRLKEDVLDARLAHSTVYVLNAGSERLRTAISQPQPADFLIEGRRVAEGLETRCQILPVMSPIRSLATG